MFFLLPSFVVAISGDENVLETDLKDRADILFFGGFESNPWTSVWGMDWGPEPASNAELILSPKAFDGRSLRVKYLKDTYGPEGGLQYLTEFSKLSIEPQEALYLRYYVRFEPGFDFVRGGKLPGLAGANANTGGHKSNGTDGWSARMMWRPDGKIVQYVYHPDQPNDYGEDFAWNYGGCPRYFKPGQWYCVETYVQMNRPGKKDGIVRSWLNGDKALEVTNLRFRDIPGIKIDKMYFSTFFGGADPSWAPSKEVRADFDNFVIAKNYIGPDRDWTGKTNEIMVPVSTNEKETTGTLLFDGDHSGWITSSWSDGKYDFHSTAQNHTSGGKQSVYIQLPDGAWGAVQFEGPSTNVLDYKTLSMWVYPTRCDLEYRVRFELNGRQVGVEKAVTGARGWEVNQWNHVELLLNDFKISSSFNRIVLASNTSTAVAPFYIDDIDLIK